jgi:hypothetical protein
MSHLLKAGGPGASVMAHVYHNGDTQLNSLNSKNGEIVRSRRVTWFRRAKMGDMIPISEFLENEDGNMGDRGNK